MTLLHIGDHSGISVHALGPHLLEPDHLIFAALTVITAILAYRYGRRVEARVQADRKERRR